MKTVAQTVIEADRFYTIAAHTGNVIQAVEASKDGGTVRLGKYDHKPEQEWSFVREGDGVYRIRNRASGKLLDLTMTGTANGTWLHLWEDVGGTSQMWTVQPTPEGTVRLRSSWAGGKCVDTVGMGAEAGAVLQIWQEVPGADQLWTIAEVKDRARRTAKKTAEPAVEAAPAAEAVAPAEETAPEQTASEETAEETAPSEAAEPGETPVTAPTVEVVQPEEKSAVPVWLKEVWQQLFYADAPASSEPEPASSEEVLPTSEPALPPEETGIESETEGAAE